MSRMVRLLFAIFILLVIFLGNFVVIDQELDGASFALAAVALNLFAISLLLFWAGAYIGWFRSAGFLVWGHATLFLSAGMCFVGLGYHSLTSRSCLFLVGDGDTRISRIAKWAVANDLCMGLGLAFVVFGLFLAWPSLKLFFSFMRERST